MTTDVINGVPRSLLEGIADHLEWDGSEPLTTIQYAYKCDDLARDLRAQLAQLQAAPAERGAPDETAMARALCNYHADLCGVNRDDQWNLYSEDFLNDVAVMLAADRRLNPAPATADSDAREVKK